MQVKVGSRIYVDEAQGSLSRTFPDLYGHRRGWVTVTKLGQQGGFRVRPALDNETYFCEDEIVHVCTPLGRGVGTFPFLNPGKGRV